jgi:hypothetical protein
VEPKFSGVQLVAQDHAHQKCNEDQAIEESDPNRLRQSVANQVISEEANFHAPMQNQGPDADA